MKAGIRLFGIEVIGVTVGKEEEHEGSVVSGFKSAINDIAAKVVEKTATDDQQTLEIHLPQQ